MFLEEQQYLKKKKKEPVATTVYNYSKADIVSQLGTNVILFSEMIKKQNKTKKKTTRNLEPGLG